MELGVVIENIDNWYSENVLSWYFNMSDIYPNFLAIFWGVVVFLFFLFVLFIAKRIRRGKIEKINLLSFKDKNKTDLDILYDLLKKRKRLKISTICKTFKIDKEVVHQWGKILESGDLANIDYPGIGEPAIVIQEKAASNKILVLEKTKNISIKKPIVQNKVDLVHNEKKNKKRINVKKVNQKKLSKIKSFKTKSNKEKVNKKKSNKKVSKKKK